MIWLPGTMFDAHVLGGRLRRDDHYEARMVSQAVGKDINPAKEAAEAARLGMAWSLWDETELVGMAGVMPSNEDKDVGVIWFLGTVLADLRWHAMTRASMRFVAFQKQYWTLLCNIVPQEMTSRIKWIERLGFDTRPVEAHGTFKGQVAFWQQGLTRPQRPASGSREGTPA